MDHKPRNSSGSRFLCTFDYTHGAEEIHVFHYRIASAVLLIQTFFTLDHHVHFHASTEKLEKNNDIILKKLDDDRIEVYVGFLIIKHKYLISFRISKKMLKIESHNQLVLLDVEGPYINCRIKNTVNDNANDIINFEIEYQTHKNRSSDETVRFQVSGSERVISLIIKSSVLGKLSGTPLLKSGVHCTGTLTHGDDSDSSD